MQLHWNNRRLFMLNNTIYFCVNRTIQISRSLAVELKTSETNNYAMKCELNATETGN